ncbi:MAG: hypothetical protein PVS3B1_09550 [Ktedonobacteraceae bacterium]
MILFPKQAFLGYSATIKSSALGVVGRSECALKQTIDVARRNFKNGKQVSVQTVLFL